MGNFRLAAPTGRDLGEGVGGEGKIYFIAGVYTLGHSATRAGGILKESLRTLRGNSKRNLSGASNES